MNPKQPLRSIKDVHSRLKWDGTIDTATIHIGYQDRSRGLVEMPFADFRPGGRVPWDRIQYFRMGEARIWDRLSRIDLVFGSGETPATAALIGSAPEGEAQPFATGWPRIASQSWDAEAAEWHPTEEVDRGGLTKWKLLTLNILSNSLLPHRTTELSRYQALLDWLSAQRAEVIALQEVDKHFLKLMLQQDWVRSTYHVAENSGIGQERSHFEVILSRIAPQAVIVPLIEDESRAVAMQFQGKHQRMIVVSLHLFSDSGANAQSKREEFLHQLTAQLPHDWPVLLMGDFNFGDEYQSPALQEFIDAWRQLHPGEPGITYDGPNNPLAQLGNPRSRSRRIDRVMLRHDDRLPFVEALEVVPVVDEAKTVLSDHHALAGTLTLAGTYGTMRTAPKTNQSALCIIPPNQIWHEIQALRRNFDTSFSRWMPHINMVYGFIPSAYFPEAAASVQAAVSEFAPFELTLECFDVFEHADSTTIYLKPDAKSIQTLRALQSTANSVFPQCNDVERHGVYNPHLTVAKIPHTRKKDARRLLKEWNDIWEPTTFTVNELSLIARTDVSAFAVEATVDLNRGNGDGPQKSDVRTALGAGGYLLGRFHTKERNLVLAKVEAGIRNLGKELLLLPAGSTALGTMLQGSDLDFVCLGRMAPEEFLSTAHRRMEGLQFSRVAQNALVPALKLYFAGVSADVSYVQLDESIPLTPPDRWDADTRARLTPEQVRALRAATDEDLLVRRTAPQQNVYRLATKALKAWAETQRIKGNAFGYPGGFAWSLMLANVGTHDTPEAWLKAFFEDFVHRDWSGEAPGEGKVPMLLLSGETPAFNITRNVGANTYAILKEAAEEALLRIWAIEEGASSWGDFFQPTEIQAIATIVLRWQAPTRRELEICGGWLQSHVFDFVRRVEAIEGLRSRPDATFREGAKLCQEYRVDLLSYPDDAQLARIHALLSELEEAFMCQPQRPSGAQLHSTVEFGELYSQENENLES